MAIDEFLCTICPNFKSAFWMANPCVCSHVRHDAIHPHPCKECDCESYTAAGFRALYPCVDHVSLSAKDEHPHHWDYFVESEGAGTTEQRLYRFTCPGYTLTPEALEQSRTELEEIADAATS